jgi:hypothetical protein
MRLGLAAGALAVAVWGSQQLLPVPRAASLPGLALLSLHVAIGAAVYLAALYALRSPELSTLIAVVRRRASTSPRS